jgi:hypothetical protein
MLQGSDAAHPASFQQQGAGNYQRLALFTALSDAQSAPYLLR